MADKSLKQSGVYCIRNIISGHVYVGSSRSIIARWNWHRGYLNRNGHHSKRMQDSWNQDGPPSFVIEVLESVPDKHQLFKREQFWIDKFNSANPLFGFNIHPNAGTPLGSKLSEEARANSSKAQIGRVFSDETRAKISAAKKGKGKKLGRPQTPEHRANISRSISKLIISPEARAKQVSHLRNMAASRKGVKISPEIRARMSAGQRKRRNLARTAPPDQDRPA